MNEQVKKLRRGRGELFETKNRLSRKKKLSKTIKRLKRKLLFALVLALSKILSFLPAPENKTVTEETGNDPK